MANTVLISTKANLYPTHIRGPVENARKAKRLLELFCLSKKKLKFHTSYIVKVKKMRIYLNSGVAISFNFWERHVVIHLFSNTVHPINKTHKI